MNKSQAALTIGKLFGTAIALSIVLIGTIAIEGLQAAVQYATSTITKLNKPQESVAILALVGCELRRAEPDLSIQEIAFEIPTWLGTVNIYSEDSVIEPFRMPINPYREIIKELPREVLSLKYLKVWAKSIGIKGYSKMSKANLVKALSPA